MGNSKGTSGPTRWFVRGDIDGFFGLALDNLVQLLLIDALCRFVLGFPPELVSGRILPGAAVSLVIGNLYYAHQARQIMRHTGRKDVCALPYGINTVSLFAYVFLVMMPTKLAAERAGLADPAHAAWRAGLIACLGSGVIEVAGAFVAERVRRVTPRAALLSTLAGIALSFISLGFLFRTFSRPLVGITTLGVVLLIYFGRVRFKGNIPGGLVAVAGGTAIAWMTGIAPSSPSAPAVGGFFAPIPVFGAIMQGIGEFELAYLSVLLPMGLFNVVGSLQNIESAEAAGDSYPTAPSMVVNGVGTIMAALFGSCFPTTLYIGHPGWKAMGARAGYSILNAVFCAGIIFTGTVAIVSWAVPIDAALAIVLWIGVVITAQAFQATPRSHAPAVVLGILPGVGAWGALMAKNGLRAAGVGTPEGAPFSNDLIGKFMASDTWIDGAFALEQGFILLAMILGATTVEVIERRFRRAAIWMMVAAGLAATGLLHAYRFTPSDAVGELAPAWSHAGAYALVAVLFFVAPWVTIPNGEPASAGDND